MAWPSTGSYTAWSKCFKVTSQASKITAVNSWYFLDLALMPSAFWSAVQADGDDLRFTQDDGETAVYHKLIYINTGTSRGLVAVAQPHGSGGASSDVDTYCYVGNAGASSTGSASVWPSSLTCLYMLQEQPTSATAIIDWTSNGRNSTAIGGSMTSADLATDGPHAGIKSVDFDSNDRATVPGAIFNDCETNNQFTWFGWAKLSTESNNGLFGALGVQFRVRRNTTSSGMEAAQRNSANSANFTTSFASNAADMGIWYHMAAVYNGSTLKMYQNGVEVGTVAATSLQTAAVDYYIGHDNVAYARAKLAEMGVYSSAFSADKIATIYTNETDSGFWVVTEISGSSDNIGTGAITTGHITVAGAGTERENGTGTPTLGHVSVSGSGTMSESGTGAVVLNNVEVSGAGTASITGSGAITLGNVEVSGATSAGVTGSGAIALGGATVNGLGSYDEEIIQETGWFLFQTASSVGPGDKPWSNASNALSTNSNYADCDFAEIHTTEELRITNPLSLSLPSDAVIHGIRFRVTASKDPDISNAETQLNMRVIKGGVAAGTQFDSNPVGQSVVTSDYDNGLHGLTWADGQGDFGSGFGLSIHASHDASDTERLFDTRVHTVWANIIYVDPGDSIIGSGEITLGNITVESPATLIGTGSITLGNVEVKAAGNSDFCQCCIGYTMSTLLEIRKRLARESGHYELVADYDSGDYADNGMDEYIRGGARYLDDKFQYDKSEAWFYKKLVEGESLVTFQNNRIIKSVWVNQASGDRKKLKRLTLDEIREQYTKDTLAGETNGVPAYWTPAILGLAPEQYTEDAASFVLEGLTDYDLIMFGNHYPHKGIYVMPPCDDTYTVEVLAEWYSAELCDDEDVSFWSQYPEILCMAARREIEIHLHRNTTGAADFERPIIEKLLDLYRNLIAEEVSGPPEDLVMNG